MPNHISNRLEITANSAEELNAFLSAIKGKEKIDGDYPVIDFNNIIPMPEELRHTSASSDTENGIYYYLVKTNQEELLKPILRCPDIYSMDRFKEFSQERMEELFAIGEKYVGIFQRHGAKDWYDWSNANWGTKWNAYSTYSEPNGDCSIIIFFQTAWSGVPNIISALTEKYPDLTFDYAYADEDMGYNCGEGYGEDGEFSFTMLAGGSDEAMMTYICCWDYDEENFYKDDDGVWHNREWEDEEED